MGVTRFIVEADIECALQDLFDHIQDSRGALTDSDLEEIVGKYDLLREWKAWSE